jgi:outer membrane receptor protein involved in Fe transport
MKNRVYIYSTSIKHRHYIHWKENPMTKLKRVMKLLFHVCILIIMPFLVYAQNTGKISGVILDAQTKDPLIGTNIVVVGTSLGASTDFEGNFIILNIPAGKYDLQVSMVGYERVIQRGIIVNSGRTTTTNLELNATTLEQEAVVIEATRPDVEREKTSTSEIIRAEDVQQIAGMRDVGDVIGLAADVTDGHFRGGRDGEELYTLQGMGITNPLDNSSAFKAIMSAVEEVEVITSGFGAQYGNAQSGVVNISMKEGKSDKWRSRVETRMRLPGKKHFGPSVYDEKANPYLSTLLNINSWIKGDENNQVYYTQMADGLGALYGGDTLFQANLARILWLLQARRGINQDYGKEIDYSVEAAAGGPIDEKMRMFIALRSNIGWPFLPTEQPDKQQQVMGNVATDIGNGGNLRISGAYSKESASVFPGVNSTGYYNWIWDRILSVYYRKQTNTQIGVRFAQTLSSTTFYEIKLNSLLTNRYQGSTPAPATIPDSYENNPAYDWAKMIASTRGAPDRFTYGSGNDDFRDEQTQTMTFEASMTSQVTKSHLLNGGIQFNAYFIDIQSNSGTRNTNGMQITNYSVRPLEGAIYVQDKMEFEGMIANVGMRFDVWHQNIRYYTDTYSPYRVYTDTSWFYDKNVANKEETPILGRLQPRVGISFPVSTETVFHLNYGSFMQRPSFQYLVSSSISQGTGRLLTLGNPRLEPQTTNSYDIGIMQGLGEGFTLDVSGYYKDVKNLIQAANYTNRDSHSYTTYVNRDYADIRGFRIALNKRKGNFTGTMNYQYSFATGKSSTPFNASPAYSEDQISGTKIADMKNVPIKDILLDFDRTHNLIINLAYTTGSEWGPRIFKIYPFADMSASSSSFLRSGRPYTYDPLGFKLINNKRTPAEYNTSIKLMKKVQNFFGTSAIVYVEVFNLFNNKILNYSYLFDQSNDLSQKNIERYELYPMDSNNGNRYLNQRNGPPFYVDQSFLIYDNSPRSYNIGLVIEF